MKHRRSRIVVIASWLATYPALAHAYSLTTHHKVAEQAFDLSLGAAGSTLRAYLSDVRMQAADVFDPDADRHDPERSARESVSWKDGVVNDGTPRGWFAAGAIREDDYPRNALAEAAGCPPSQSPPAQITRPLNHFYDVQRAGAGLTVPRLGTIGLPSPDWGLGAQGRGPGPAENHFSILDAREYQYASLTTATKTERDRQTARLFRALGHVAHLLQDAAQPQHTRNDPHSGCLETFGGGAHSWYEDYTEKRATGQAFRFRPEGAPPLRLGGGAVPSFPTYRDHWASADHSGIADLSSRQFLSEGTNFGRGRNGPCGGLPEPACDPDAAPALNQRAVITRPRPGGGFISGPIDFIRRRIVDPITGQAIVVPDSLSGATTDLVRVSSRSLWDKHLQDFGGEPKFAMNVYVYDEMADALLPRAVGYSAGLLEHFFRGRLDVAVKLDDVNDPGTGAPDPDVRQLIGVNASDDTLGPGTISILAEDLATGERHPVAFLGGEPAASVAIGPTPRDAPIRDAAGNPIRFRPPFPAERYVVAYAGDLGAERRTGDALGAVLGKVIGGERVEGIVSDGDRRLLRTPDALVPLPSSADGLHTFQWGDPDNTFVGLVSLVPGETRPDRVKVFRIARERGAASIPRVTRPDGSTELDVEVLGSVPFPYGLSLDTVVDWSHVKQYRQALITYELAETFTYDDVDERGNTTYRLASVEVGPPALEIPVTQTATFGQRFPIVLDEAHLLGGDGPPPRPYAWRVAEVGFDAQQRVLALVEVQLTVPEDFVRHVDVVRLDSECRPAPRGTYPLVSRFPISSLLSALIDVETGRVLGTTATRAIETRTREDDATTVLQRRFRQTFVGGPLAGTQTSCFDAAEPSADPRFEVQDRATLESPPAGITDLTLSGWYRDDLEALVATAVHPVTTTGASQFVYFVDGENRVNHAVRLVTPVSALGGYLTHVHDGRRMRPAATGDPQILLRFARPVGLRPPEGQEAVLVQWSPVSAGESRLAFPEELPPALYELTWATPRAAMLRAADASGSVSSLLVEFDPARARRYDARDLAIEFVLLAPELLYNVNDTRFYTLDLEQTALPRPLVDGPTGPAPVAAFHVLTPP